jgi:hypothetical protein
MTYFATLPECRGVGLIVEIPGVHCQEKTYEELKETLGGTLRESLKFDR